MEQSEEKINLKRKQQATTLLENLKSKNFSTVFNAVFSVANKISKNDQKEVVYKPKKIVKALIRGLGSSNIQVQKNYFAALITFLKTFKSSPDFSTSTVLEALKTELHATGNVSKAEEREILIGKVLTFGVLVRSGVLKDANEEEQSTAVTYLLSAVKQKSYLPLLADSFFIDFLKEIDEETFKNSVWPSLSSEVHPGPEQSLLIYHSLLVCEERFPNVVTSKYLKANLTSSKVLSSKTVSGLLGSLNKESNIKNLNHSAYADIVKYLVAAPDEVLYSFWHEVEIQLLVASPLKQLIAVKLFSLILSQLQDVSKVPNLLTPKLLMVLMKKNKVTYPMKIFYNETKDATYKLIKLCEKANSSKSTLSVIKKLIFDPGNILFDQTSGTKTVWQLVGMLKEKHFIKLTTLLKDVVLGESQAVVYNESETSTRIWTNKEKLTSVHLIRRIMNLSHTKKSLEWRLEQVIFLFDTGFFPINHIGVELAGCIREGFFSCLNYKLASLNDLRDLLAGIVVHIQKRLLSGEQLRIRVAEGVIPAWNKMCEAAKKIGKKKGDNKEEDWFPKVFQVMFYHVGLHLFKEQSFAIEILEELHSVYKRVSNKSTSTPSKEEPHWMDVVIEMFLSLLSRNSHLHRHLLNCVFSHFCQIMTPQNIYQILQVLDPTNNENPILSSLESDSESSAEEDSPEKGEKEEEDSSDDGMTDGDDIDMEEEEEKVNDKLRMAVIEALGDTGAKTDTESVDLDNMDEEEAKRVDQALSRAFQAFKPSKNKKKESVHIKALVHFRIRVLDLIEVWLIRVHEPPLDLVIDILVKLIVLLEHAVVDRHQSALESRLRFVIKKYTKIAITKKFDTSEFVSQNLEGILKSLLEKGERSSTVYLSVLNELKEATIFIVKASQRISEADFTNVLSSALQIQMDSFFFQRERCLLPANFFVSLFSLSNECTCRLAFKLPEYAQNPNVCRYRRLQSFDWLMLFLKNNRLILEPSDEILEGLKKMSISLYETVFKLSEEPEFRADNHFFQQLKIILWTINEKKWLPEEMDVQKALDEVLELHKKSLMKRPSNENISAPNKADKQPGRKIKEELQEDDDDDAGDNKSEDEENDDNASEENSSDDGEVLNNTNDIKKENNANQGSGEESDEEDKEMSSENESNESSSESEEPPSKKSRKKADKKMSREKLRRIQLLKNNSKKLRMESMSAGLDENVFSKYKVLLKNSASPER